MTAQHGYIDICHAAMLQQISLSCMAMACMMLSRRCIANWDAS